MALLNFDASEHPVPRCPELPAMYDDLSADERRFAREEYASRQGGDCVHCGEPLLGDPAPRIMRKRIALSNFPEGFLKWPQHLHHDHDTGLTIGTVHARCNAVLWQYHGE